MLRGNLAFKQSQLIYSRPSLHQFCFQLMYPGSVPNQKWCSLSTPMLWSELISPLYPHIFIVPLRKWKSQKTSECGGLWHGGFGERLLVKNFIWENKVQGKKIQARKALELVWEGTVVFSYPSLVQNTRKSVVYCEDQFLCSKTHQRWRPPGSGIVARCVPSITKLI